MTGAVANAPTDAVFIARRNDEHSTGKCGETAGSRASFCRPKSTVDSNAPANDAASFARSIKKHCGCLRQHVAPTIDLGT